MYIVYNIMLTSYVHDVHSLIVMLLNYGDCLEDAHKTPRVRLEERTSSVRMHKLMGLFYKIEATLVVVQGT